MMAEMIHLNGNIMCAVDTETTGTDWEKYDIWQIAVVPLDSNTFTPNNDFRPFYLEMKPRKETLDPENPLITKPKFDELCRTGMNPYNAADQFAIWCRDHLKLPDRKRILPVCANWPFDAPFLRDWLGPLTMDYIFDARVRDLTVLAQWVNDLAAQQLLQVPFARTGLNNICHYLSITNPNPHDAICDAITTAKCWKRILDGFHLFADRITLAPEVGPGQQ